MRGWDKSKEILLETVNLGYVESMELGSKDIGGVGERRRFKRECGV